MRLLRGATKSSHDRIEGALPFLEPGLTRARYTCALRAFYGYLVLLEPLCEKAAGSAGVALDLPQRRKLPLLAADLTVLGHTPGDLRALPRCRSLPSVTSASQAMGALYVTEGATLGGQIIGRHLRSSLELDAGTGAGFFAGYGDQTREMWTRFASHVDRAVDLDLEATIATAIETFGTMERWFVEVLATR
jgi:heme oxygenase